jgi:hypothetical protein
LNTAPSATGTILGLEHVLCRKDAARRAEMAGNAAASYEGWRDECRRLFAQAETKEQRRVARGYMALAEQRIAFERQMQSWYADLAAGKDLAT